MYRPWRTGQLFTPESSKDWKTNDRGRRLDHMWASPELAKQAVGHSVHEYARDWEKPSDHVPLVTEFTL